MKRFGSVGRRSLAGIAAAMVAVALLVGVACQQESGRSQTTDQEQGRTAGYDYSARVSGKSELGANDAPSEAQKPAGDVTVANDFAVDESAPAASPECTVMGIQPATPAPQSKSEGIYDARRRGGIEIEEVEPLVMGLVSQDVGGPEPKARNGGGRRVTVRRAVAASAPAAPPPAQEPSSTEQYAHVGENPFRRVADHPLSTFSIDVDTASYSNVRRFLQNGQLPPPDSVRIEELINYFPYDYALPTDETPFAVHAEVASCPWQRQHRLVRIGLKGRELTTRPDSNLVFLLDVSGSMSNQNKLPLVKRGLSMLIETLTPRDKVAIVVYAGASGLVLPSTPGSDKKAILDALERLNAGGSTNGGAGIELAYKTAGESFLREGNNRVILCTDGDFNVGTTGQGDLQRLIEEKAKGGVFLSVLGFGMGNYKDSTLETLADKGNGNYAYIDSENEARKVLVHDMTGTLFTIAKDVKIQVDFNPQRVEAYRLVGYVNRMLRKEDFTNDKVDAGEIGAGHSVTALYEIVPAGQAVDTPLVEPSKYRPSGNADAADATVDGQREAFADELCEVRLRYKLPDEDESTPLYVPVRESSAACDDASSEFRFAAAVAEFGMLLRGDQHVGDANWKAVVELAADGARTDPFGYRTEFLNLVQKASELKQLAGR